jgi:hypothetical protein
LEFSCTAATGSDGVFDCMVVVSLEVVEGGTTTTGGLAVVFIVTVLLVTLGAAGMVETVVSDSVVVFWHHALPARLTASPIAAAETHKLRDFIFPISCLMSVVPRSRDTELLFVLSCRADRIESDIVSLHRRAVPGQWKRHR